MQLTDAQAAMVEKNHKLIYNFLKKHDLEDDFENWYGIAALGLCKAAMHFDEDKGCKFSTIAFVCMENEVRQEMRKMRHQIQPIESLDMECLTYGGDECGTLADHISDPEDFRDNVALQDVLERVLQSFSDRDREIIQLYYFQNMRQRNIAQMYKMSSPGVSKIINRFITKMRHELIK